MPLPWYDRLERRFGALAVPGLASLLAAMNAAVWALTLLKPDFPSVLALDPGLLARGELWRLATFLFIPPRLSALWMLLWLALFLMYARALEERWGDFRFNLFYGVGAACTAAAALALGRTLSNIPLNLSLFLAFAALHPEVELLLFFVLPVKVKWLALLAWAGVALALLGGSWPDRAATLAGLANYLVFFGPEHWQTLRLRAHAWRHRGRFDRRDDG